MPFTCRFRGSSGPPQMPRENRQDPHIRAEGLATSQPFATKRGFCQGTSSDRKCPSFPKDEPQLRLLYTPGRQAHPPDSPGRLHSRRGPRWERQEEWLAARSSGGPVPSTPSMTRDCRDSPRPSVPALGRTAQPRRGGTFQGKHSGCILLRPLFPDNQPAPIRPVGTRRAGPVWAPSIPIAGCAAGY